MLDMPFLFMMNIYQAVRQAQGDTLRPMLLNLVGISLNLVLDPLLMITWGMSSAGAALATVLSKAVPAGIAFCLLRRPGQDIRLQAAAMRPERDKLMAILRIGLPTALGGSTMQLGFLLMSRSVYVYGVNAMAAYGIGNKVNGLISLPSNAIGSAVGTIVGQNMGAKQPERAAKGYRLAMYCAIGFLFVGGQLLALRPVSQAIVSIFASDADVIAMAADFLSLMAAWCWTNGIYNATSGLFQGAGHTEVTMAVDASGCGCFALPHCISAKACFTWVWRAFGTPWSSAMASAPPYCWDCISPDCGAKAVSKRMLKGWRQCRHIPGFWDRWNVSATRKAVHFLGQTAYPCRRAHRR